jgi:hypothetical protein
MSINFQVLSRRAMAVLVAGAAMALPVVARAQGISNGVPTVVSNEGGEPVIVYGPGATPGISSGLFRLTGTADGSARVQVGPGAHGNLANGGIPVFTGGGANNLDVTYLEPNTPATNVAVLEPVPVMTPPRAMPATVSAEIGSAKLDLSQGRVILARQRIEAAETLLLNDRQNGEHGWKQPIGQLENALAALDRHDEKGAIGALPPIV